MLALMWIDCICFVWFAGLWKSRATDHLECQRHTGLRTIQESVLLFLHIDDVRCGLHCGLVSGWGSPRSQKTSDPGPILETARSGEGWAGRPGLRFCVNFNKPLLRLKFFVEQKRDKELFY